MTDEEKKRENNSTKVSDSNAFHAMFSYKFEVEKKREEDIYGNAERISLRVNFY